MEQRTYHGSIAARDLVGAIVARFTADDMNVAVSGEGDRFMLNITSGRYQEGRTTLAVSLGPAGGGVTVTVGDQNLLGVAADLVQTGLGALRNPLVLIGEIDDVARNVQRLNLPAQVWEIVEQYARSVGAGLTPAPTAVACPYCGVLSPLGVGQCQACGAPLGRYQPVSCSRCGLVLAAATVYCTRCGAPLRPGTPARDGEAASSVAQARPKMVARFD